MRMRRAQVMGFDKWVDVEMRVSKADSISMFNFKEGPKWKMLKVQYFQNPKIAHHLYDRFLASYGRLCHIILRYCFMQSFS